MRDPDFDEIRTERLSVRRFHVGDRIAFHELRNIDSVARYQSWPFPYTESETKQFVRDMMKSHPGTIGEWFQFVVSLKENGRFIGDVGLKPLKVPTGQFMLGYSLFPEHQGQGYMTEALTYIIQYAFQTLKLDKALAYVDLRNDRSIRLLEGLNFRELKRWENFGVADADETLLFMIEKKRWRPIANNS